MLDDIKHFTSFCCLDRYVKNDTIPRIYLTLKISRIQNRMIPLLLFDETWIIDFVYHYDRVIQIIKLVHIPLI